VKPKLFYLALCILGAVLPYWQFIPWLAEHGVNGRLFVRELFATRISTTTPGSPSVPLFLYLREFLQLERTGAEAAC